MYEQQVRVRLGRELEGLRVGGDGGDDRGDLASAGDLETVQAVVVEALWFEQRIGLGEDLGEGGDGTTISAWGGWGLESGGSVGDGGAGGCTGSRACAGSAGRRRGSGRSAGARASAGPACGGGLRAVGLGPGSRAAAGWGGRAGPGPKWACVRGWGSGCRPGLGRSGPACGGGVRAVGRAWAGWARVRRRRFERSAAPRPKWVRVWARAVGRACVRRRGSGRSAKPAPGPRA